MVMLKVLQAVNEASSLAQLVSNAAIALEKHIFC